MTQFDDKAFIEREDNMITLKVNINQYHTIMAQIKGDYVQVKPFGDAILAQGEPQKEAIVARYEAELKAFNDAEAAKKPKDVAKATEAA